MKLWCYNDVRNWGIDLAKAAAARGHDAHLFDDPKEPTDGYVFFHMHHHPMVRLANKRAMALMALNPNLTLIPDYRSSVLYDDKIEQARQFSRWMPRTRVFYTPGAAYRHLAGVTYPFISKASEGASSHNVRLVADEEQARQEIRFAFSDLGLRCRYGQTQRGYLLWQDFVPNNTGDVRIIAIGRTRLILKRQNRDDRPMASGSGKTTPVTAHDIDDELTTALHYANEFFTAEKMLWCGVDLVRDNERWYVLESTVGWTMSGYTDCEFFGDPQHRHGNKIWEVFLDELEDGVFE